MLSVDYKRAFKDHTADTGWTLAPAHDVTHAHNPDGEWTNKHLLEVNCKFTGIDRADLLAVADRFCIGTATKVMQRVGKAVSAWGMF